MEKYLKEEYAVSYIADGQEDVYFIQSSPKPDTLTEEEFRSEIASIAKERLRRYYGELPNDFHITKIEKVLKEQ